MKINFLYQYSRAWEKLLWFYRKRCFEGYVGRRTEQLSIVGKIYLRNRNVHIGKNVTLYPGVMLHGEGEIYIGDNTFLSNNTVVYSEKGHKICIGANCMIAPMCYITNTDHNTELPLNNEPMSKLGVVCADTVIEDNVWLAAYATVLKGSHIHSGAVVGAKALVKGEVAKNSIVAGIPAKTIKCRTKANEGKMKYE